MKSFDGLYAEITERSLNPASNSMTTDFLSGGVHQIGKKLLEEAGELWLAIEHESDDRVAEEAAQLIYFVQLAAVSRGIKLEAILERL